MENTNEKIVEIEYNGLKFTVDFTKKGVPPVYFNGKQLAITYNRRLNRNHFAVYLPLEYKDRPGISLCSNGYGCIYNIYCYRLIAAGLEKLHHGEFDYEKFKDMQVDHIDGNPSNDNPSNIHFTTRKRNNNRKMAKKRRHENRKHTSHSNEIIKATKDGVEVLYKNGMDASRGIGCSHVLVYRVLNEDDYASSAKGWKLEYVPLTYGIITNDDKEAK